MKKLIVLMLLLNACAEGKCEFIEVEEEICQRNKYGVPQCDIKYKYKKECR